MKSASTSGKVPSHSPRPALFRQEAKPQDLVIPDHILPLRARNGGVLVRAGQTEMTGGMTIRSHPIAG
jgi:hypothetical protein